MYGKNLLASKAHTSELLLGVEAILRFENFDFHEPS